MCKREIDEDYELMVYSRHGFVKAKKSKIYLLRKLRSIEDAAESQFTHTG